MLFVFVIWGQELKLLKLNNRISQKYTWLIFALIYGGHALEWYLFGFLKNFKFLKIDHFCSQRMLTSKIFIRPFGAGKMWYREILECWIWPMNQILIGWINTQSDSIFRPLLAHWSFLTVGHFGYIYNGKIDKPWVVEKRPKLSKLKLLTLTKVIG